jgi:FAD/FMN-containing dehydrogenase
MPQDADWQELDRAIEGAVVRPHSPDYDQVREAKMVYFHDLRPQAVVVCASPQDVAATTAFARRHEIETAIRSGGHSIAGLSSTSGLVLDVTGMNTVSLGSGVATVGAGVRLGALEDAMEPFGLAIPSGSSHSVGIAGLTLGGGLGILGRTYALTCDHLLEAQVVLADGSTVRCDEHHEADLFWGLRGAGGGALGVVTSLVLRTVPAPEVTVFQLSWPFRAAPGVIVAWQGWAPEAPDQVDATLRLNVDGDRERAPTADVFGAMLGAESEAVDLIDPLVAHSGADPSSASFRHLSYRDAKRYLDDLPPEGIRNQAQLQDSSAQPAVHLFTIKSEFFRRSLPPETAASLIEGLLAGADGQTREVAFTPWGGAYNRVPADATAFAHRSERFIVQHLVSVPPEVPATDRRSARAWLRRSWGLVHPWGTGGVYPNFPDPDLGGSDAYLLGNRDRFLRIKAMYDPEGFFRLPSRRGDDRDPG